MPDSSTRSRSALALAMRWLLAACGLLLPAMPAAAQPQASVGCSGATVTTSSGHVCGIRVQRDGQHVDAWLGIPYALPPTGELRWAPPLPAEAWPGVLPATQPGSICPQPENPLRTADSPMPAAQAEDCLSLNIWAPLVSDQQLLPVLVYIHGGAFTHGSSTDAPMPDSDWYLQDGSYLAANQQLVVASFNYRLGALGFLAAAGATGLQGNFGFQDQLLALDWLQRNLSAFGGDPERITLAGESAGAMSVGLHLLSSPASADLFHAAVMQSNPLGITYRSLEESRFAGDSFLVATGCLLRADQLACLRDLPVELLLEAQAGWQLTLNMLEDGLQGVLPWAPVIDGELLVDQPLRAGLVRGSNKPLLIGYTADEGLLFVAFAIQQPLTRTFYAAALELLFGSDTAAELAPHYPFPAESDGRDSLARVVDDAVFVCPALAFASVTRPLPVFSYVFSHEPGFDLDSSVSQCSGRSCHATELSFVFGTGGFQDGFSREEQELARQMGTYWAQFTRSGGQAAAMEPWPLWTHGERQQLEFRVPNRVVTAGEHNCNLWLEWASGL